MLTLRKGWVDLTGCALPLSYSSHTGTGGRTRTIDHNRFNEGIPPLTSNVNTAHNEAPEKAARDTRCSIQLSYCRYRQAGLEPATTRLQIEVTLAYTRGFVVDSNGPEEDGRGSLVLSRSNRAMHQGHHLLLHPGPWVKTFFRP